MAFLIMMLMANTFIGLGQLAQVHNEFAAVAHYDVALMETLTSINEYQLEKNVLLEKLIAIAEELGFEQTTFARAQYLSDQIKVLNEGFDRYTRQGLEEIARAKKIIAQASVSAQPMDTAKLQYTLRALDRLETVHVQYDALISQMLRFVQAGGFQLSLDDVQKFKRQEDTLSKDLKSLLVEVQGFVRESLERVGQWQRKAYDILLLSLGISAILGLLLAFWIVHRISYSLRDLGQAARQVGQGNFVVDLKTSSHDEIAEVAQAFNAMSAQLQAFTRQLEEKNKTLAASNQELDRFAHTVSHDIVEPLTAIIGYSAYLEDHYAAVLDQKGKDTLAGVRKGAVRMDRLVKDLLELTRMKRIKNPYGQVNVAEAVDAALANCAYAIDHTKAQIKIETPLPVIVCDRIKLTIAFTNLIGNAVKFSAKHRPNSAMVRIGYKDTPEAHEFYVIDNGIGIEEDQQQTIFDIFVRLHSIKEYEGSGAGLAIVKAALEDQGGTIRVQSKPGEGATFIFTIPHNLTPFKPLI